MTSISENPKNPIDSQPDRFGIALLLAIGIVIAGAGIFAFTPKPPPTTPPSMVRLQVVQPAPTPTAAPPVPQPPVPTPPKPVTPPPQPVTPPLPMPPPPPQPHHVATHTRPHPVPHPAVHQPTPPQPTAAQPPVQPAPQQATITAAPPPSLEAEQSALSRYTGQVRGIILSHLIVPQQLVEAGLEGDCVLEFTLAPDGTILSASILTPSGLHSVNETALNALRASRLPAFIDGMQKSPSHFTLPVHVSGAQND
jgi:protein TonB